MTLTMIPDEAPTSQKAPLATRAVKALISALPHGAPARIYNAVLRIPVVRWALKMAISSFIPEKIDLPGFTLFLDRSDPAVSGSLALSSFESFETSVLLDSLKPGMNVVDIGAHIGYYAIASAKRVGPSGKVFAYEPEPRNYALLAKNAAVNGAVNVIALNTAISDRAGERQLFIDEYNKGHHSFAPGTNSAGAIHVKTDTLDDSLAQLGDPSVDIVKMDIEGAEPIALRGMKETLARNPSIIIFAEFYPRSMRRLGESPEAFLQEFLKDGFVISVIDEAGRALLPLRDAASFVASFPKGERFVNLRIARQSQNGSLRCGFR